MGRIVFADAGWVVAFACAGAFLSAAVYARVLAGLRHRWEPYWTWVTVVIGNALIGGWFWGVENAGRWSGGPGLDATTYALFALCCAAGGPVIAWQIGRRIRAKAVRQGRNGGNGHGAANPRGGGGAGPAPR